MLLALPFVLVSLLAAGFARRRVVDARAVFADLSEGIGEGEHESGLPAARQIRPGLARIVRSQAPWQVRRAAFDELVGQFELERARLESEGRGLSRLAVLSGVAAAFFVLCWAMPQPASEDLLLALGCVVWGGLCGGFASAQAGVRRRGLSLARRGVMGLRRALDSRETTG